MSKLAVVDIGTNSIHMVLAEIDPDGSYKILDRFKDMTRLGDGTFKTRRLSQHAIARGLEVLRNLTTLARNKGYDRILMTATSAVREAKNGGEFIERVARETGVRVRVVTGQEEARLIYLGVRHSMEMTEHPSLIVDVGGGSVEFIVGNRKKMLGAQSCKLGAIRLKDQFLAHDPPTKKELRLLNESVIDQIHAALNRFKIPEFDRVIASSGMAGNLAEICYLRRTGRPIPQLNLASITLKELRAIEEDLAGGTVKNRLAIPGLDPRRVDTLLPAAVVLRRALEHTELKELTISDKAIREGVVYDFIDKNQEGLQAERDIPNIRLRNVIALGRRCHFQQTHAHHVAKLALTLFDQMQPLHGLGEWEREWLEYAALLHDVGYMINPRQHHKHSYYLIKHSDLAGFTADEIEMIASVARFHRRALPGKEHDVYQSLSQQGRIVLVMLAALLRIADGLDRSHFSVVQDLRIVVGKTVTIHLTTMGDSELEIWTARSRADLFEKVFKRKIEFVPQSIEKVRVG